MSRQSSRIEFHGAAGNRLAGDLYMPDAAADGVPVLLLHGGGQTRHAWGKAAHMIAEAGHAAVTMDQRGHGDSDWVPSGAYAIEDFAEDAIAVAGLMTERLGAAPVLVGASLGGLAGLMADYLGGNTLLSGLVLVDVTPNMDPDGVSRVQGFMGERMREGFASLEEASDAIAAYLPHRKRPSSLAGLAKNLRHGGDGRYRWHWDPAFIDGPRTVNTGSGGGEQTLVAAARGLTLPTLLVRGQQSELVTEDAVAGFLAMAPHATFVDVTGAGHMVAGDRNDAFNAAVLGFLDSLPRRSR
ncbi:pimeloyl-ACP methyl ester carboxylesterase [Hoeflea marina]|uniref:Pimeloyl-ACP methyl ester carboxylesterase n=1 Tax=Hoeflea marina TaxID=274592 RepID=A0A317PSV6_9HYPH|nr:alpha/beta hydrolase [Hoeflea marina]PWW03997.1 pimeloyl-ACP methyl ester carboxylesterase [Hoeflea marina]